MHIHHMGAIHVEALPCAHHALLRLRTTPLRTPPAHHFAPHLLLSVTRRHVYRRVSFIVRLVDPFGSEVQQQRGHVEMALTDRIKHGRSPSGIHPKLVVLALEQQFQAPQVSVVRGPV